MLKQIKHLKNNKTSGQGGIVLDFEISKSQKNYPNSLNKFGQQRMIGNSL